MKVIISDQPDSIIKEVEYIKHKQDQFLEDIENLVDEDAAKFYGRCLNNNRVYKIFGIEDKRVLIEDPEATQILSTLFDDDDQLREFEIHK